MVCSQEDIRVLELLYRNQGMFVQQEGLVAAIQLDDPIAVGKVIGELARDGYIELNRISGFEVEARITDAGIELYETAQP
jgi:hypothetical protein